MKRIHLIVAAALAFALSSCIEHNVMISLNKDGSGTITEETLLGAQASAMLAQMAAIGGEGAEDPLADMVDEAKAKETAAEMGEGVTVSKVEKIDQDGKKGGRIVYAFKDINQLEYHFGDSMADTAQGMNPEADDEAEEEKTPMKFDYTDGVLTLVNPDAGKVPAKAEGEEADADADDEEEIDPAQLAMVQGMMGDMRMSLTIECPGGIEEADATYVDGNQVTFVDFEMGKLIKDPEAFKRFMQAEPDTPAEMQEVLKGVDAVKIETKEKITIKLK